jgi:DNA polymerase/3'-5' exonuclease PolX
MQLELIQPLADALVAQLSRACVRIIVAGSIRRRKPEPGDIEIVAIPALGQYGMQDLWGATVKMIPIDHLADALETLFDLGAWELDPVTPRNGPRYKRLRHVETGVCCDLFITDRRRWGIIATIRTGPGDFSKALVQYAHGKGMFVQAGLLHGHPPIFDEQGKVRDCPLAANCPQIIETPEEADVFRALDVPWIEPAARTIGPMNPEFWLLNSDAR